MMAGAEQQRYVSEAQEGYRYRDRRRRGERRVQLTHPLSRMSLAGRRQYGRRASDRHNRYVDRYERPLGYVCIGLALLSCLDAFFTLHLLAAGASEANPFMNFLLGIDVKAFAYTKIVLTSVAAVFLVAHHHFSWLRVFKVSQVLYALFFMYLGLIQYELFLIWKFWPLT